MIKWDQEPTGIIHRFQIRRYLQVNNARHLIVFVRGSGSIHPLFWSQYFII